MNLWIPLQNGLSFRERGKPISLPQSLYINLTPMLDRLSWQGVALLRCAVHIGLFFQSLYGDCPRINELLTAYIQYLIETNQVTKPILSVLFFFRRNYDIFGWFSKKRELVALYTSRLPVKDQVETYAQFLRSIEARHERERCLDLADKAGLTPNNSFSTCFCKTEFFLIDPC